ncbi:MAG: propionyl-CoA carboxylase [Candidatus Tectimicrobiota bacterium]|nr:MAG: propionyl-CoA carboxylase [Candidatus Tectomicrobia bacterium]
MAVSVQTPALGRRLLHSLRRLRQVDTDPALRAAARQHARGKLTVAEKIALLFDPETFVEDQPPSPELDPRHGERRLVTGHGHIHGRRVAAALFDSAVAAGAVTVATGRKLIRQMQQAEAWRCPLLIDWDSSGADINEGVASLDIFRQIFTQITEISGRIPTLSIVSGLNAGGGAYAPVMTDTVIMLEGSMMAVTGPLVIKVATGEDVTPEEMGGVQLHTEKSGEAHYRAADYAEAAALARRYLSYLPQSMWELPPCTAPQEKRGVPTDLRAIVTQARLNARRKRNAAWDVRTFIDAAVDDDSWFEYHEKFGPSAVVGFARIAGIPVAIIANQRLVLGGSMTAASSSKVTRFLKLANAYHLPVITFVDVPGFIATQAESEGQILSKGAALLMMYPNLMVPRISVVIDKAFGGAYCAMDSLTTSVRSARCRHYGFTTGQIAVMGKEAGPFFTYGPDGGDPAVREQHQERYENEYLNMDMAFAGGFVQPLEPEALRARLVADLPPLYAEYVAYWQALVQELDHVRRHCPNVFRELRHGAIRGLIHPL